MYVCTHAFLVYVCTCVWKRVRRGRERERGREGEREGKTEYGNRVGRGRMGVLNWYASCTFLMKRYNILLTYVYIRNVQNRIIALVREICFIKFGFCANDPTSLKGIQPWCLF